MAADQQTRSRRFNARHQLLESSKTNVVLRNSLLKDKRVSIGGPALYAQQLPQIIECAVEQGLLAATRQLRCPSPTQIRRERHVSFRSTARKQRRGEDRPEDAHPFGFRHKNPKSIERMRHVFAAKSK